MTRTTYALPDDWIDFSGYDREDISKCEICLWEHITYQQYCVHKRKEHNIIEDQNVLDEYDSIIKDNTRIDKFKKLSIDNQNTIREALNVLELIGPRVVKELGVEIDDL